MFKVLLTSFQTGAKKIDGKGWQTHPKRIICVYTRSWLAVHSMWVYPIVVPSKVVLLCFVCVGGFVHVLLRWAGQIKAAERHSPHSVRQWYFQQTAKTVKRSRQRGWLPTRVRQHAAHPNSTCCVHWLISFEFIWYSCLLLQVRSK